VHWKFDAKTSAIVFYRVETRSFNVRALLTSATVNAGIGLDGQSGGGTADNKSGSNFDSTSKTDLKSEEKISPIESVMSKVRPFLSKAGSIVAQPSGTNSMVVTDTVEALRNIEEFLDRENRTLTRRVRLVFEEVNVAVNDQHEGGIDWRLIYSTASAAAGGMAPVSAVGAAAGTVASGTVGSGPFKGSDAIIRALDEIGTTTRQTAIPLSALNRRPVTYADRKTFSYINEVQTTGLSSSDSSNGSFSTVPNVSVRQKDVTVGQFLTLVPDAQDDGQILLTISYDSTINDPLQTIKFGDDKNGIEIQQLTVRGNGMVQQVALQAGQPLVIAGFQKDQDQVARRRMDKKAPILFGGSDATNEQKTYTLIIVTAQVEEGL
jgi:type IVB pilus formation R64 PilN family outer membrane protein